MAATKAGELEELGFDEIEPGLIEDTPENRRRLYALEGSWIWERDRDEDGSETGLIRPIPGHLVTAARKSKHSVYRDLLVDPEDAWSDYVGPDDWPMDAYAPPWVEERVRRWKLQDLEGIPESERKPFPIRCTQVRSDGTRCWLWVGKPQDTQVCSAHARSRGRDMARIQAVAKMKLIEMTPDMVDGLEHLAWHAEGEAVRLKAMTEVLDRAGIRSGFELEVSGEVEVKDSADAVKAKLDLLRERAVKKAEREEAAREAAHLAAEAERLALPASQQTVQGEIADDES
jgi:hypothetical protein